MTRTQINQLADYLLGKSCSLLYSCKKLFNYDPFTMAKHYDWLDEQVKRCDNCGVWKLPMDVTLTDRLNLCKHCNNGHTDEIEIV